MIERFSADGLLVYQTGVDEHKIDVPVSWLPKRYSWFIALQRPSSAGIRPAIFQIERFLADGLLVYQTGQDEHKIDVPVSWLSCSRSQFIALQRPSSVGIRPVEYLIERFLADGLLVYQTGVDEHKIDVPVSWLPPRYSSFIALQRPSSVGIRPAIFQIERFLADGLLVYQTGQD